jgi:hypothetical protein
VILFVIFASATAIHAEGAGDDQRLSLLPPHDVSVPKIILRNVVAQRFLAA